VRGKSLTCRQGHTFFLVSDQQSDGHRPKLSLELSASRRLAAHRERQSRRRDALDYSWFDLIGNVGVLLMVVAYLLLQLERLSGSAISYLLLNALGAILVMISLAFRFNLSAFLMEAFWLLISLYGLTKPLFRRRPV
jgi:hypothetical protein